ncbi:hypothetical protein BN2497_5931 [Janthinobacterium sp. CG23_2]|nr:hypothetical protein BN2497_5657 [Janthinobacterium sp. CG23_2]CUI05577.1 hypothetical protein BN2497_5931 [Janthinobacterium sp. CG23_2]CUU29226.1 hypothetical protein BN3177_5657 [Janthinobacterium sp. CG23_2]CUU29363.1 hypothetical protein BN3177_5931 [Janthinobacterium sp. CG23_2]
MSAAFASVGPFLLQFSLAKMDRAILKLFSLMAMHSYKLKI